MIQCCWFWLLFFTQIYAITFVQGFKVRILKRKHNIPNLHRILPVDIFSQLVNGMTSYSTATSERSNCCCFFWEQTLLLLKDQVRGFLQEHGPGGPSGNHPIHPKLQASSPKGKEHHILNRLHLRICREGGECYLTFPKIVT